MRTRYLGLRRSRAIGLRLRGGFFIAAYHAGRASRAVAIRTFLILWFPPLSSDRGPDRPNHRHPGRAERKGSTFTSA
jgi:hypothetical protein